MRYTRNQTEFGTPSKLPRCNCHTLQIRSRAMKEMIFFALLFAIVVPMFFGNFWFFAVTGFIVEATVNPLLDMFLDSIGPD